MCPLTLPTKKVWGRHQLELHMMESWALIILTYLDTTFVAVLQRGKYNIYLALACSFDVLTSEEAQ